VTDLGERVAVGRVRGLHGLRGAVRVEVLTDQPEVRFAPGARVMAAAWELTVVEAVPDGRGLRVRFREVPDRTTAESLRDLDLEVAIGGIPALEGDAVYWHELVGVRVLGIDGSALGIVHHVYRAGAAEVLVVDGGPSGAFDLPVVKDFVREWTPRRGVIVVDADALDLAPPKRRRHRSRAEALAAAAGTGAAEAAPGPADPAAELSVVASAEDGAEPG